MEYSIYSGTVVIDWVDYIPGTDESISTRSEESMFSPSRDEYGYGQYEYYPGRVRVLWYCGTRYPGTVVLVLPGSATVPAHPHPVLCCALYKTHPYSKP